MPNFYYTKPVAGGVLTYLNVACPLKLDEPMGARQFDKVARFAARKLLCDRQKVRYALGGGDYPALEVINSVKALGLDPKLALAEAGYDAVISGADSSIHPLAENLEYETRGSLRLTEHAKKSGMMPVYRYSPISFATADTSAGGAVISSSTEAPPGTQRRLALSQHSTQSDFPSSEMPRTSNPSTNLGSSTTSMDQGLPLRMGGKHPQTGRTVYHETDDLTDLGDRIKAALPLAEEAITAAMSAIPGARPRGVNSNVNAERLRESLGFGRALSNVRDVIQSDVWLDHLGQADDAVNAAVNALGAKDAIADDDFTSGLGRDGYRARHVNIPIGGTGISALLRLMPRETGEVLHEAWGPYGRFTSSEAPLGKVLEAKEAASGLLGDAFRSYGNRIANGARLSESGNPPSKEMRLYLNVQAPISGEEAIPAELGIKLSEAGIRNVPNVGAAYKKGLDVLTAGGVSAPRDELHKMFLSCGFDSITYKREDGRRGWMPLSKEIMYDPNVAKTEMHRLQLSEFAEKAGMLCVDENGIQLGEFHGYPATHERVNTITDVPGDGKPHPPSPDQQAWRGTKHEPDKMGVAGSLLPKPHAEADLSEPKLRKEDREEQERERRAEPEDPEHPHPPKRSAHLEEDETEEGDEAIGQAQLTDGDIPMSGPMSASPPTMALMDGVDDVTSADKKLESRQQFPRK